MRQDCHCSRLALREKNMADKGQLGQLKADADGFPETLEVLVDGVNVTGPQQ